MSVPKVSLGSWAFSFGPFADDPWSFEAVAEYASAAGYDGIEINGFHPHPHPDGYDTPGKCRDLVRWLDGLGLGISAYAPDFTAVPPALCRREEYLEVLKRYLAFCVRCGIATLRVDTVTPPDAVPEAMRERRLETLADTWRAAAEEAGKSGVTVVWEFEPGFWLNKPSEVRALADRIDHPNFRLLFDTSHAYMGSVVGARHAGDREILGGGLDEYARRLLDRIGHVHLIDSNGRLHGGETSIHETFGQGLVDFRSVLGVLSPVLRSLDWVCVDFCFNPDTPAAAKEAVPFVKELLQEACA